MAGIELNGRDMIVRAPTYPSKEIKEQLGGRWDKDLKAWRLPPTSHNVLRLGEFYGEDFIRTAPEVVQDLAFEEWGFAGFSDEERTAAVAHPSWDTLYPFQREAVEYMFCNPHSTSLLGLSPGLGKTPVSVVCADLLKAKRILILAPVTLCRNWMREIDRWEESGRVVTRATAADRAPGTEVTVANHEVIQEVVLRDEDGKVFQPEWVTNARKVKQWREDGPKRRNPKSGKMENARERIVRVRRDYLEIDWDVVICDESILLKNRKAVKADVLKSLTDGGTGQMWMLSGSPTSKFRDDLWKQLNIMFPRGFSSYWRFAEFFCVVERGQWGWSIEGDKPNIDPHHYLRDFMFVRSQDDVLPDLPDYIYRPIEIEFSAKQRKAFDSMLNSWVLDLEGERIEATNWLSMSTRLQQITSNMGSLPKEDGTFHARSSVKEDLLVDLIKQGEVETPMLVWAWFIETAESMVDRLRKEFKDLRVGVVHGNISNDQKDDTIEAYQDGKLDILVFQMGVGKFGHTFTDTKTVFYADRAFDSDAWVQSLRRVRRIGLKHRPVLIVPKVTDSVDELIDANLAGKLTSIARMTKSDLAALLRSLGRMTFEDERDFPQNGG